MITASVSFLNQLCLILALGVHPKLVMHKICYIIDINDLLEDRNIGIWRSAVSDPRFYKGGWLTLKILNG